MARTYWGLRAITNRNEIVSLADHPEAFFQYGQMNDGSYVYTDASGKEFFIRMKFFGKFLFIKV